MASTSATLPVPAPPFLAVIPALEVKTFLPFVPAATPALVPLDVLLTMVVPIDVVDMEDVLLAFLTSCPAPVPAAREAAAIGARLALPAAAALVGALAWVVVLVEAAEMAWSDAFAMLILGRPGLALMVPVLAPAAAAVAVTWESDESMLESRLVAAAVFAAVL